MKKRWFITLLVLVLVHLWILPASATSYSFPSNWGIPFNLGVPSAILVDARTGQILYEHNAHTPMSIASITKIMTLLLALEAVENGDVRLDDVVTTSAAASRVGGSQVYLAQGERFTLEALLESVAIASANDAAHAVAEHVAGSVEQFVKNMNERARQLGMTHTHFVNPHGLPPSSGTTQNTSSAFDITIMARELLKHDKVLGWTSTYTKTFREDPLFILTNTNKLVRQYDYIDGLKTGYTSQAGYCLVATGEKDGIRLIAVVLQTRSVAEREQKALQLLEFGFNTFERFQPDVNEALHESIFVANAQDPYVKLVAAEPISLLIPKAYKDKVTYEISLVSPLEAPIAQDERMGELKYMVGDQVIASTPLLSSRDVPKASGVTLLYRRLKQWVHTNPIVSKLDDWLL